VADFNQSQGQGKRQENSRDGNSIPAGQTAEYFFNILLCGRSCEQKISDARGRRGEISKGDSAAIGEESAVSREIAGADENQGRCPLDVILVERLSQNGGIRCHWRGPAIEAGS
jgi:hypothetical protein